MRHLNHLILVLCGLLLLPVCAFAQDAAAPAENSGDAAYQPRVIETADAAEDAAVEENVEAPRLPRTAKDNFGGFRLGGDIMAGIGRCDSNCIGSSDDHKQDVNLHVAGALQINLGYVWGNDAFVGPELNLGGGYPFWGTGDVRIRLVLPINYNNAISMSAGWGVTFRADINDKYGHYVVIGDNENPGDKLMNDFYKYMYIPVQVGYEHAFDNGFILGVTLEARMAFNSETNVLGTKEERKTMQGRAIEENLHMTFGMATAGIHMGYAF